MGIEIQPPGPATQPQLAASTINHGQVTAPAAAGLIAAVTPAKPGEYQVQVYFLLSGTVSGSELDNIKLLLAGATVSILSVAPVASPGGVPTPYVFTVNYVSGSIAIEAVGAGTATAVYSCTLVVTEQS